MTMNWLFVGQLNAFVSKKLKSAKFPYAFCSSQFTRMSSVAATENSLDPVLSKAMTLITLIDSRLEWNADVKNEQKMYNNSIEYDEDFTDYKLLIVYRIWWVNSGELLIFRLQSNVIVSFATHIVSMKFRRWCVVWENRNKSVPTTDCDNW